MSPDQKRYMLLLNFPSWSDGWGNPKDNSLPACRVEKLVQSIRATYTMPDFDVQPAQGGWYRAEKHDDSVYFWIDTLCVPREPHHIHSRASEFFITFN